MFLHCWLIPGINWANLRMLILYSYPTTSLAFNILSHAASLNSYSFNLMPTSSAGYSKRIGLWLGLWVMCVYMIRCMNRVVMRWVCVAQKRKYKNSEGRKPLIRHPLLIFSHFPIQIQEFFARPSKSPGYPFPLLLIHQINPQLLIHSPSCTSSSIHSNEISIFWT